MLITRGGIWWQEWGAVAFIPHTRMWPSQQKNITWPPLKRENLIYSTNFKGFNKLCSEIDTHTHTHIYDKNFHAKGGRGFLQHFLYH